MNIEQHAPPRALRGRTAASASTPDPWAIGVPPGYAAALARLQRIREEARALLERAITDAIEELDAIDADPDLECGGDQVGELTKIGDETYWESISQDENAEPSLGSVSADARSSQENWDAGASTDAEGDEHDGAEPDVDELTGDEREPSLGSIAADVTESQAAWSAGDSEDHEGDFLDRPGRARKAARRDRRALLAARRRG